MKPNEAFIQKSIYCNMIYKRTKIQQVQIRLEIIKYAQLHGIKPAAKKYGCSKNTIKKWLKRFQAKGSTGLINCLQTPKHIPHKTSQEKEQIIIDARKKVSCYGPKRLKMFFALKESEGAIYRVLKQNDLIKKIRKKYQKKRDLRNVKAKYITFSHHQEDVKHLYDQPYYWPQMEQLKLPKYEYTIRDTKSGFLFLGFANRYTEEHSTILTEYYLEYLKGYGIPLKEIIIQTDNGSEFGGARRNINDPGFVNTIEIRLGAKHTYIPPRMCNANADVESAHARIEEEFFDLENFNSIEEFFRKAQAFQYFFNIVRPNFHKKGKTPFQILMEDRPKIDPKIALMPVVDIDELIQKKSIYEKLIGLGGQHVHKLPEMTSYLINYQSLRYLCNKLVSYKLYYFIF